MSVSRARLLALACCASWRVIRRATADHCALELVREADRLAMVLWRRYWACEDTA